MIAKTLIRKLLRGLKRDLVFLTPAQQLRLSEDPSLSYRDLIIEESLVSPAVKSGELRIAESRFLTEIVKKLDKSGPIVEIGTLFGSSARVILLAKAPDRELISVDAYCWNPLNISSDHHHRITSEALKEAVEDHHVRLLRMDKNEFYTSYDGPTPSLVFCDAIHTYEETKRDIDWAMKVGASVICGHDYDRQKFPGVVQIVDELGGPKQLVGRLWVL